MADNCRRSGIKIYAGDNPIRVAGMMFHPQNFTCASTGTQLTLRNYTLASNPADGKKDVFLRGKEPILKPKQVIDVNTKRVTRVPDARMKTGDGKFNIAGKGKQRGIKDSTAQGSAYGLGAVEVLTQTSVTKPPTTVNNINLMEKLHNGTGESAGLAKGKYTGAGAIEPPPSSRWSRESRSSRSSGGSSASVLGP
jgi:hypothetical protein